MEKEELFHELRSIALWSLILDAAAYLISLIFIGVTLPIAVGLAVGTLGMLLNLFLLNRSVVSSVLYSGNKGSARYFMWYLIRMGITVVIVVSAYFWSVPCMIGAAVPYIYPKLIYGGKTFFKKGGKD